MSEDIIERYQKVTEEALQRVLPVDPNEPGRLCEAMRYSVLGGGKRVRPCMVLACCEACGGTVEQGIDGAVAVELIHAYSLVHDDLPAMDDDALRRGKPSCHVAFGEATAILVGDALLTLAFEVLTRGEGMERLRAAVELARQAGYQGLVGGQSLDLALSGEELSFETLERIHKGKTAALFQAAAAVGAILARAPGELVNRLRSLGESFGLAFQHVDDALDNEHEVHAKQAYSRASHLLGSASELACRQGSRSEGLLALVRIMEARLNRAMPDAR